jgi:transcriptional regulator with XRE-family HTH domain
MQSTKLGQFLKSARGAATLSQGEIAEKCGYTTSQFISNWERGVSLPPANVLGTIATAYKLSLSVLVQKWSEQVLDNEAKNIYTKIKAHYPTLTEGATPVVTLPA